MEENKIKFGIGKKYHGLYVINLLVFVNQISVVVLELKWFVYLFLPSEKKSQNY